MLLALRSSAAALACLLPSVFSATLLVSHYNGNVYSLTFSQKDGNSGSLAVKQTLKAGGAMPSWLTLDSATGNLYLTDEGEGGGPILTTLRAGSDGTLGTVATANSPGGEVHCGLFGGSDGKGFIAVAEYDLSSIATFKLPLSSSTKTLQRLTFTMNGAGPNPSRQDKPHPHSTFADPTGNYLLVPDLGADMIRIFSIDTNTGMLTQCTEAATGAGDGPRHGAFWTSGSKTVLYIVNELGNSLTVWNVNYPSGGGCMTLTKTQSISSFGPGKSAPTQSQPVKAAEVHVSGSFVYVANRNDQSFGSQQDSIATYSIDAATGAATWVENVNSYSWYPRTFQINKAGTLVAVGGQTSSNVAILSRNATSGHIGGLVTTLQVGTKGHDGQEDGLSAVIWDE